MATFVLVHGAWSGGWGFQPIARALRAAGHEAHIAQLTGLGERAHLLTPAIDLSIHIRDVVALFEYHDLDDVILCGHSYGGMVITGVAGTHGARIRTLFYLDAFVPEDGQSVWDLQSEMIRQHFINSQGDHPGLIAPLARPGQPPSRGPAAGLHPLLSMIEPVRIGPEEAKVRHRTYIHARVGGPNVFTGFHDRLLGQLGWKVGTVEASHMVTVEQPDTVTALLLEEVERR